MRIDIIDASKAALTGIACIGSIIGLTELLSRLEQKWEKKHGEIQIYRSQRRNVRGKDKQDRMRVAGDRKETRVADKENEW